MPVEVVLTNSMQPCLLITARGVFKVKDGKKRKLKRGPELAREIKAFWLSQALDKDFDPGERNK